MSVQIIDMDSYMVFGRLVISHYWQGRECSLPNVTLQDASRVNRGGARMVTVATAKFDNGMTISGKAFCCPRDQPSRAKGRFIALLRLTRSLRQFGLCLARNR